MPLLQEGQHIRDTYVVERCIGEGAFAEVYRVRHKFLGRQALKVLRRPGMTEVEIKETLKEAALLSRLGHPNIVRVFDANTLSADGHERGYFTMELVSTGTLEDYRLGNRYGPIGAAKAVAITIQILQGLEVAHEQAPPIVHRDLKPQNILIANGNTGALAKISDFGLATQVDPLTLMSCPAGTLAFKSPEAIFEGGVDSIPSDIWSIGVILYLLLTDTMPYPPPSSWGWSAQAFRNPHRPVSSINVDANEALDSIVSKCLKVEPHRRYASAKALLGDLRRWKPSRQPTPSQGAPRLPESRTEQGASAPAEALDAEASHLARQAESLAANHRLAEAADLAERAISIEPRLLEPYARKIGLWRKGLSN